MSILERPPLPPPPAAETPSAERLRVITAGSVGNIDALLGASGFDVVAVAQTEDALIDAVSTDEPNAIVVDADLCDSLEHVRDLAPDALLIAVGDHTPAGALGRIEQGVSGTVMAGLLHALVAEGVGAAAVWGLVPAFGSQGLLRVHQHLLGSLLSTKADLVRAWFVNALHDPAELVIAAGSVAVTTAAVTVSAGVLLTLSAPHRERPERSHSSPAAMESAVQHPEVAVSPTTPPFAYGHFGNEGEPGDGRGPNPKGSQDHGLLLGEDADDLGQSASADDDPGQNESADEDPGQNESAGDEVGQSESADDEVGQSENAGGDHSNNENAGDDNGKDENAGHNKGDDGDAKGDDGDAKGDDGDAKGDDGDAKGTGDKKGGDGDDQGDDQGDDGDDQGADDDAQSDDGDAQSGEQSDGGDQATDAPGADGSHSQYQ
jgi:hypothetical protein